MDTETIKTIVSIQFTDAGIDPLPIHLATAVDYYNRTQDLPTIDHVIAMVAQNNETMNAIIPNIINQILGNDDGPNDQDDQDYHDEPDEPDGPDGPNEHNEPNEPNELGGENNADGSANTSEDEEPPEMLEPLEFIFNGASPANPNFNFGSGPFPSQIQNLHEMMNMAMASAIIVNTNEISDVIKVLPQTEIDKLSLVMVKDHNDVNTYKTCLNCYDQFLATELVRILPCGHPFHRSCIDDQLQSQSHLCPYCKKEAGTYVLNNV